MTLVAILAICAAVVSTIGWAMAQRALASVRERAGNAEGQASSAQHQLYAFSTELRQVRDELHQHHGLLAKADAERDSALDQMCAAEGRAKEEETRRLALAASLDEAGRLAVEKDGELSIASAHTARLQQQMEEGKARVEELETDLRGARSQIDELHREHVRLGEKASALEAQNSRKDEELTAQKQWVGEQTEHLRAVFAKTASELLDDKAAKFGARNKEQIEGLMKPFQDQLGAFRTRIDQLHTTETGAIAKLEQQVTDLAQRAAEVGATANNLANAMLGNPKAQGNWGEMQLTTLMEQAGFVRGRHFDTQVSGVGDDDEPRFADTVLYLPQDGCIVIDSKVTLASWVDYCSANGVDERRTALVGVIASLRKHFQELASKNYPRALSDARAVPFTLMFIPIEPAAIEAFREAPELFTDSQKRNVLMVTPTTLFCVLQLVYSLWNVHDRQENALEIAEEGRKLLRKLNTFMHSFKSIGDSLGSAVETYETARGQLQSGKGNLVSVAERMAQLGVEIPKAGELARLIDTQQATVRVEAVLSPTIPQAWKDSLTRDLWDGVPSSTELAERIPFAVEFTDDIQSPSELPDDFVFSGELSDDIPLDGELSDDIPSRGDLPDDTRPPSGRAEHISSPGKSSDEIPLPDKLSDDVPL